MDLFFPRHFFSLEQFAHKEIWQKDDMVWAPLGRIEKYLRTLKLGQIDIKVPKTVHLERADLISIGKGTVIEPGVMIQGPCVIGQNCIIRHSAYLRENLVIGNRCVVGHSAELKNSVLLDAAAVTHFVYVGDSIIGNFVNLGAGVKCANLRIDRDEVRISFNDVKIKTGLKKLGAILGDRVQIGCNCVLNPGTIIGKQSVVYPLLNVGGTIAEKSLIKRKISLEIESIKESLIEQTGNF